MEGPGLQTVKEHSPRRGNHSIARVLHVSLGLISILLAVLFGLFLLMTFLAPAQCRLPCPVGSGYLTDTSFLKLMAFFFAGTVFFWLIGLRLISGRRARTGGGLLSPTGYRLYGVLLALMAMNFSFRSPGETSGLLISGTLSLLCFVVAQLRAKEVGSSYLTSTAPASPPSPVAPP